MKPGIDKLKQFICKYVNCDTEEEFIEMLDLLENLGITHANNTKRQDILNNRIKHKWTSLYFSTTNFTETPYYSSGINASEVLKCFNIEKIYEVWN